MIGYYVHHQGDGHSTRAQAIARHLAHEEITGLSSRPRPAGWEGQWLRLASDDEPPVADLADPTAGGALHWAPSRHPGLRTRMAQIAAWVASHEPRLVVVDVSVEVAVLVRTMGVPTVVMAMPGKREDAPHQLAYRLADAIIAPWPAWADVLKGGAPWRTKTHHVGAISRFDGGLTREADGDASRVLVLSGQGGTRLTLETLAGAQRATPSSHWTVLGPPSARWETDPWPLLHRAGVVVTHAGQNAIADVAAARRPAVVIAQPRPHAEQRATAAALRAAGLAVVLPEWPAPSVWSRVLDDAVSIGGSQWTRWSSGSGAARAAEVLQGLACAPR
jgi:Glycosyltransferase family 28 C-terminal domain